MKKVLHWETFLLEVKCVCEKNNFFPAEAFACLRLAKFVSAPSMHVSCAAKPARLPPQQCFASTLPVEGRCIIEAARPGSYTVKDKL